MKTNKNNIFRKWMIIAIICLFAGVSVLPSISSFKPVFGEGSFSTTLYVGGTGPGNYTSIQSAINDATSGDTVFVYSGTYYENIVIDVSINLIGENRANTYIDGSASGDVVQISADYVDVMEFSIGNSGSGGYDAGIEITSSNNVITYCKIYLNYGDGIRLSSSSGNTISNCDVFSNGIVVYRKGIVLLSQSNNNLITNCGVWANSEGIDIDHSDDNDVTNCNIYSNIYRGIYIDVCSNDNLVQNCDISNNGWAIYLYDSDNTVYDCSISGNDYGISIYSSYNDIYDCSISGNDYGISIYSSYNDIYDCSISGNDYGIYAYSSHHDNHIYHNDFSGNTVYQAYDSGSNVWDDGYPSGGNYWDDYTGTDEDEDGIGDIPYPIYGGDNEDRYPLGYFQENQPPNTPSNPNPPNDATEIDVNADLSWTGGDPDSGDTVTYDVYFGTASNPPNVVMGQSSTTYDPGTLDYDTKYYWRIDAWDNHGASTTGYTWNFQTVTGGNNPPYVPSNPVPSNGATGVDLNADLSWTGGDPDSGDTVTYDVYFGTASNPPNVATSQFGTLYDPGTLDNNTQYYWRVVAWDNHGVSNAGSVWTFRTVSPTNNPPNKPTIGGLTSGKAGIEYEYTFVTTDPDGDNVYYYIEWGDDNIDGTSWIGPYESGEEIKINHSWSKKGTYLITAKAKDINDAESDYATLEVSMPKSKTINPLMLFIERLINHFPLLEKILQQFN
jgi:parallel beta-helix repeat protein